MIFVAMDINAALQNLTADLTVDGRNAIKKELSAFLNQLLLNDFSALVQILYRVDVSEKKLRSVLEQNKEADAGDLIAELLIQRQLQKQAAKNATPPTEDIPDEERW